MCKISTSTIERANKEMIERSKNTSAQTSITSSGISVDISYKGRSFSNEISFDNIREAYGKALRDVKK